MGCRCCLILLIAAILGACFVCLSVPLALFFTVGKARENAVVLPAPAGQYPVGRLELAWSDPEREEIFTPQPGDKRSLLAWVWYPAEQDQPEQLAPYLDENWSAARQADQGLGAFLFQDPASIFAHSQPAPPAAQDRKRFPLLVFSTGYGRIPADYTALAEDLASRGYIVAAVANPYSASVVVFPDGRTVYRVPQGSLPENLPPEDTAPEDRLVEVWAGDILSTLKELEAVNRDPSSRLYSRLDLEHTGFLGHSFGGAAAAEACRTEPRCLAALDIDGWLYGMARQNGLDKPFLILGSDPLSAQAEKLDEESYAASLQHGARLQGLPGSQHMSFTDLSVTFSPLIFGPGQDKVKGAQILRSTAQAITQFFNPILSVDLNSP